MPRISKILCLCAALLLSACDEWPPHQQEIVDHFYENETKIVALRKRLLASEYVDVSNFRDVKVFAQYYDRDATEWTPVHTESPPDEDEWLGLFADMHVDDIGRHDYESATVIASTVYFSGDLTDEIGWKSYFVHDPAVDNQVAKCSQKTLVSGVGVAQLSLAITGGFAIGGSLTSYCRRQARPILMMR
jgi:hypothetical protein